MPPQQVNTFDVLEMPGAVAVAVTILNDGDADVLLAASSPVAREVQLHVVVGHGTERRMALATDGIPIPPGLTLLDRDGPHPMLVGLREPLVQGRDVPLTLRFARAGEVTVRVRVRRRVDAAGLTPIPPVTAGALTILLASAPPAPMAHATPVA